MNIDARIGHTAAPHGAGSQSTRSRASRIPAPRSRATRQLNGSGRWQMPMSVRPMPTRVSPVDSPRTA